MKKLLEEIGLVMGQAFAACGYDEALGKVTVSNRPDLCEYQCNGAMAGAKRYKKAPIVIANEVVAALQQIEGADMFASVEAVMPGFLNLRLNGDFLADYARRMAQDETFGCEREAEPKTIVIDYGGANVAKPLHVGHLRPAVIGESLKRILRFFGNRVIGDVHLGDWGMPIGLIIEELKLRKPELPYFDENYQGAYPEEAPFTIAELEEIYPTASAKSKEDAAFKEKAHEATFRVQNGDPAYSALLKHILNVSIPDLKKNYGNLNVTFDLWYGESNAQPYIPAMLQSMKEQGLAYESQGALVMDVKEEGDTKEIPPILLMKADGAYLYHTTDLATLVQREQDYHPASVIYVVDKRQELHFVQVFRCAKKSGIVSPDTKLIHIGFGTMNGKDGGPFKTRDGGVMRLEMLLSEIYDKVYAKMMENQTVPEAEAEEIAKTISLAALKYGDLSNQASKDYVFDVDRFSSFDGDTGPYILYTIVRIKSILQKYYGDSVPAKSAKELADAFCAPTNDAEKDLYLMLIRFNEYMQNSYEELAPHKICAFLFEVANRFNKFYHDTKILSETDAKTKEGYIALITLTKELLELSISLLGFSAPDRM